MTIIVKPVDSKFHLVNIRLNRTVPFDKFVSDGLKQDLKDDVNISKLIKILLYAHYLTKQEAERVE